MVSLLSHTRCDHAAITSRWDDHSDEEAVAKDVPGNLPKSRWLDDEAEDATDKPPDGNGGVVGAHQADHASLKPDENLVVPTEDPEGLATDGAPLAQESAAPVHPRKRNMLLESRGKDNFEFLREIGSGTYGLVSKCAAFDDACCCCIPHLCLIGFRMTNSSLPAFEHVS